MELAPYGDLSDFIIQNGPLDEKLARTLFRQLISGLEYLHEREIAHLDLKPDNILIGQNLELKISDFDLSYMKGDEKILSRGTEGYRPPEVLSERVDDTQAVDVYSAGIILFALMFGMIPYKERGLVAGQDFFKMILTEDPKYWDAYKASCHSDVEVSDDFKQLFKMMVKADPVERATISEIKKSVWFNGPVLDQNEFQREMSHKLKH